MSCYLNHSFRAFCDELVKPTMLRFYNTDLCEYFKTVVSPITQVLFFKTPQIPTKTKKYKWTSNWPKRKKACSVASFSNKTVPLEVTLTHYNFRSCQTSLNPHNQIQGEKIEAVYSSLIIQCWQ
uniref:Uncharacterized protein n=1 Tax=Pipistrellus kuhlii TaxID=59472 RepID=A0A7J7TNF6_PIPKU|nr:hypothetical protein mPipKuh1_009323 [Pipistrellus kuhlii]